MNAVRETRNAEVAKLFPRAIFGEQTILSPFDGYAPASVVAETWVEVLGINKQQLNQFAFSRENLEDVRKKAMVYPATSKVYVCACVLWACSIHFRRACTVGVCWKVERGGRVH